MYLSTDIPVESLWLLGGALACVALLATIYLLRVRTVTAYRRRADHERPEKADADYLPASVIVYSQGDADELASMLTIIVKQDYPAAFEVIVVNEGESVEVRDTVSMLRASNPNLYLTFTPQGVVNLSRKKLALTLGIKAARYDIVVLTTTAADIESPLWLKRMMRPFDRDGKTEIVLGHAYIDPDEDTSRGRRHRAFDHSADSIRWLGTAIARHPFRGTEYNIAYRKQAFLRNKGFARSLNLHYGDDDIFISEIARPDNTTVELSEESMVRLRHGNSPRMFRERVLRRAFTESHIGRRPRFVFGLTGWLQLAAAAASIAGAVIAWPKIEASIAASILLILMATLDIAMWRPAMRAMKSRTLLLTLPWLSATYPLRRLGRSIRSKIGKQKKYTWD